MSTITYFLTLFIEYWILGVYLLWIVSQIGLISASHEKENLQLCEVSAPLKSFQSPAANTCRY